MADIFEEYVKEYEKIVNGTKFVVKSRDQIGYLGSATKFDQDIKYITIVDYYNPDWDEEYELTIKINSTSSIINIYEDVVVDVYAGYEIDDEKREILKKIVDKTIELSRKNNIKKIIIPDDLHGLAIDYKPNIDYLLSKSFRYIHDGYIKNVKTKEINLQIIQMIIVKKVEIDLNKSRVNESREKVLNILKEVKLIYKRNKWLKDFKNEMKDQSYWSLIDKEIYEMLGMFDIEKTINQPPKQYKKLNIMELIL